MRILGLHPVDALIVAGYLVGMLWIGLRLQKKMKTESDFFLSGRGLGKFYQFFLTFGNSTDANGAASVSTTVFTNGVGGVWMGLQTLFLTPFYWFTGVWFRRCRLITMGDLFVDRFNSKKLAGLYASVNVFFAVLLIGVGYLGTYKVMSPMLVKPESAWTAEERQMVDDFNEYKELNALYTSAQLPAGQQARFAELQNLVKTGRALPYISYVSEIPFYLFYAITIAIYVMAGGLQAAAITDAFQGILIIVFSLMLIPMGLSQCGGFSGLHERTPDYMFLLFGSVKMSEFTWYSIFAITLGSLIQIFGLQHNMAVSGSARSEYAARLGQVTGTFAKRFMILAWMVCGLIAFALYAGQIPDPDNTWGVLCFNLLKPGLLGVMVAGMLAANMSTIEGSAIALSGLFVRNLYEPLRSGLSQAHYVKIGRFAILAVMSLGILLALKAEGVIPMYMTLISFGTMWGATVVLIFFWRPLTERAVFISVVVWVMMVVGAAWIPSFVPALRQHEALTIQTREQAVQVKGGATLDDVEAGLASAPGEIIEKTNIIAPVSVYFEKVARIDPADPASPMEGSGRFRVEVWLLARCGIPVANFNKAQLICARWMIDSLLPFAMLMLFSLFTRKAERGVVDRFYAKMRVPVIEDPDADERAVAAAQSDPAALEHLKMFPKSGWEFGKWTKQDAVGFAGCWAFVGCFLVFLWFLVNLGA